MFCAKLDLQLIIFFLHLVISIFAFVVLLERNGVGFLKTYYQLDNTTEEEHEPDSCSSKKFRMSSYFHARSRVSSCISVVG